MVEQPTKPRGQMSFYQEITRAQFSSKIVVNFTANPWITWIIGDMKMLQILL